MTKAQLVERIVKGPRPITAYDEKGAKHTYQIGETVHLPPHAAKSFARYLTTPEVARAEKVRAEAETKAAAEAEGKAEAPKPEAEGKAKVGGDAKAS